MFDQLDTQLLWQATGETVYMVAISTFFSALIGIPLGVLLVITDKGHLWEHVTIQRLLGVIVNLFRAVPFIVLVLFLFPLSKWLVGTTLGPTAATIPLIAGAAPFYARMVETAIREIDRGVIEAALAMGATRMQIVRKVLCRGQTGDHLRPDRHLRHPDQFFGDGRHRRRRWFGRRRLPLRVPIL